MLCAISGEAPQEPVVSKKTGTVYEKRLIQKYIEENGKEPGTDDELDLEDLLPIQTGRIVRPRPPTLTSIPALLSTFQDEWDAMALETYNLREQLARTREELATALYQHDAAVRVVARLTRERNEARDALSKVSVAAGPGTAAANGAEDDAMAVDSSEALPQVLVDKVEETQKALQKSRKKRPLPEGWITTDDMATLEPQASEATSVSQATSMGLEGAYAAVAGLTGEATIILVDAGGKVERSVHVGEPVTDTLWTASRIIFATTRGSVKVFESGTEVAFFAEHAGAVTGLAIHPCKDILASVGSDKSFVFYDLMEKKRVARVYTDHSLTTCAFHPDGHLFAAGTTAGDIRLFMTATGEQAAVYELGAPVQALAFSENGYWVAATAKGQTTVTIFDLRKEGDAATAKVLDIGAAVQSLAWDYSGQYLATAGPAGITVQQYAKGGKKWTEPVRSATPAVSVRWGEHARHLASVNGDGVVTIFGIPAAAK